MPITDASEDGGVAEAVMLARRLSGRRPDAEAYERLGVLARQGLAFTAADVHHLVDLAAQARRDAHRQRILGVVAGAAEQLDIADLGDAIPAVERAVGLLEPTTGEPAARAKVRNRLRALLPRGTAQALDLRYIRRIDSWSDIVIRAVTERFGDRPVVGALVEHLATMPGHRPSKVWRDRCQALVGAAEDAGAEVVGLLLRATLELEPGRHLDSTVSPPWDFLGRGWPLLLSRENAEVVRGAAWAAALTGGPDVAELLHSVYLATARPRPDGGAYGARAANGCIAALAHLASPEAIDVLVHLRDTETNGHVLAQIDRAMAQAAGRSGLQRSEFDELHVSDGDLDVDGRRVVELGNWLGVVALNDRGEAELSWVDADGKVTRRVPRLLALERPDEIAELREARRMLEGVAVGERARLDQCLAEDRTWDVETWAARYVDHPLTGRLTRNLLWRVELPEGEGWTGLPDHIRVPHASYAAGAVVRPWHPLHASDDEVRQWRRYLFDRKLHQPVEQAFRPVYRLMDLEGDRRETLHFVGYELDARRARQAMKELGWRVALGAAGDPGRVEARRDVESGGLRVAFGLLGSKVRRPTYWLTRDVRFLARRGRAADPVPLGEVPAIVVSEALYDIDRVIDASRHDREPADEELVTERGFLRGEVLAAFVLPTLPIADRCEVADTCLVVQGRAQRYRIHLGTAAVLDEAGGPVALDPARARRRARRVFLPFEQDGRLARIVGVAFELARPRPADDADG